VLPQLIRVRSDAVSKIFDGSVAIEPYSVEDQSADVVDEQFFVNTVITELTPKYSALISLKAQQYISDLASFYDLGVKLLRPETTTCPFCLQEVGAEQRDHISKKHAEIQQEVKQVGDLGSSSDETRRTIRSLQIRFETYLKRNLARATAFTSTESSLEQIDKLLLPKYEPQRSLIREKLPLIKDARAACTAAQGKTTASFTAISDSLTNVTEDIQFLTTLGEEFVRTIAAVHSYRKLLQESEAGLAEANSVLRRELDTLAGTQEISILIDLLEGRQNIEKRFEVTEIIDGLKTLRSKTEDFVGQRMLDAISGEFTDEVMSWYGKIRTTGDPDVHFAGFDMKKAASGNRVQIKATSYGRELVSAVSSLSESKLNALGLCISIAINLKAQTPFEFLIIDDPIQSWDLDHETKFIDVIRELVKAGKQVILLSHNQQWIKQVRSTCDDLNGICYHITGYTVEGPHIAEVPWAEAKHRLNVIDGILKNPHAGPVELQQAEEEIRLVINQLAGELNIKKFGTVINTKNMTPDKVQKTLLACGVEKGVTTKLVAAFGTVDPAHHSQADYAPSKERIREYYGRATNLAETVKSA
jgi:DNA repair exonuclease SbcCD ATPase subunit